MAVDEIVEGLRLAVSKGEPLEKAMTTFYNSGYKKEDIEQAAAAISQFPAFSQVQSPVGFQQPMQIGQQNPMPSQLNPLIKPQPTNQQRVSDYKAKPKGIGTLFTVILIVLLFLLLGGLAALILFKDQISSLLG